MCGHTQLLGMKKGLDCLLFRPLSSAEGFVWDWLQDSPMQSPRLGDTLWRMPSWVRITPRTKDELKPTNERGRNCEGRLTEWNEANCTTRSTVRVIPSYSFMTFEASVGPIAQKKAILR